MSFREFLALDEDGAAVNCAGGGAIAGIGVGPQGEPGGRKKKRRDADGKSPGRRVVDKVGFED